MSPGRKPRLSPASTAGRARTMRRTRFRASASTAAATARYVLPVPAGPMPTTMSFSAISRRYSACPGVFGWMTLRTPGSTMRAVTAGARPSRAPSMLMRSTSSASSASPCLRGVDHPLRDARSRAPRPPPCRRGSACRRAARRARRSVAGSSIRLASFTPASVSRSAPSVFRSLRRLFVAQRGRSVSLLQWQCAGRRGPRPAPASARPRTARAPRSSSGTR